jgi:hypothetical protein
MISTTRTVKLHRATLPDASVAAQLTGVLPIGKRLPVAGAHVTVGAGSQASVAVTLKGTTAPARLVASTVMDGGQVITGEMASPTFKMASVLVVEPSGLLTRTL